VRVRFPRIAFLFACAVSLALPLAAQSPNGTINGLVLDPSNKVIGGADILVINDATGVKYTSKTNNDGIYVVPNLQPGPYRIQVSKVGFKTLIKPDIVLNIQAALSINFTLPVGAVFETVTVEGGASVINTTDASVSTVVDETYVKNMPLNGRSFQDLVLLTPGIVTNSPQQTGSAGQTGEFSVNGQRTESNNYSVDGVSANTGAATGLNMLYTAGISGSVPASTALGTTQALVSVDDLQEFRVQSSTYSAEYGRSPGGQIAFETKSGTNRWHGTAFDYLRNGAFDAQDWFNDYFGLKEPALRQNDFGGTIGGAVLRNRTFFFVSYEGLRLAAPHAATTTFVPDLCLRGLTTCPSGSEPAPPGLQPLLNAFPLPSPGGIDDVANGFAAYFASWSNPSSLDSPSFRIDHVVSERLKLFFRFSSTSSNADGRGTPPYTPSTNQSLAYSARSYTAGTTSMFTSRLANTFRLNYSSNDATSRNVIDAFGGSTPIDLAAVSGLIEGSEADAIFLYSGYLLYLDQQQSSGSQHQWNLIDTVSFSTGRHQFKFGVDFRRLTPTAVQANPAAIYYFLSQSQVETNSPFINTGAFAPFYPLYRNFSAFAQDEWRMSQRLTVSFGLRWEINPAPGVTKGLMPYTLQGTNPNTVTLAAQGTPLWRTTWYNFAPRFGVAYVFPNSPGWETVVRGGGGVFFDTGEQLGSLGVALGFRSASGFVPVSFPTPAAGLVPPIVNPPVPPYQGLLPTEYAPHLQLPYTLQWNASIEQALGKSQALTASYVGARASRLLQTNQVSAPNNPNLSQFDTVENGLTSDYDALQVQFRRRLTQGLTVLASYTLSHCIDYGSENFSFAYQRGNCDFDVRHNLSAAFSYDLPSVRHSGFVDALLNHWGLDDRFSARSAFPVTLNGNELVQPDGQIYHGGLSSVRDQPVYLYGANCASVLQGLGDLQAGQGCPGGRAINPLAFTPVDSGLGDTPRNFARGFDAVQMDLAVRRDFRIYERLKLQFRAEAFNVFNHPNFGMINSTCGGTPGTPGCTNIQFGQAAATLANSLGVLNPLYQTGGPRSMQLSLKFVF